MEDMIAVITGDIINSRAGTPKDWLANLKSALTKYGKEPKSWEIYRGDSFQLQVAPALAIEAAMHIKASIMQSTQHNVRLAIGIGEVSHAAKKITESNGEAFVRSGECFESLKKQSLAIRTGNQDFDEMINLMLGLALLTANSWTATAAEVIVKALENPSKPQKELAAMLAKSQSSVSESLKRGGFEEIMQINRYYKSKMEAS